MGTTPRQIMTHRLSTGQEWGPQHKLKPNYSSFNNNNNSTLQHSNLQLLVNLGFQGPPM